MAREKTFGGHQERERRAASASIELELAVARTPAAWAWISRRLKMIASLKAPPASLTSKAEFTPSQAAQAAESFSGLLETISTTMKESGSTENKNEVLKALKYRSECFVLSLALNDNAISEIVEHLRRQVRDAETAKETVDRVVERFGISADEIHRRFSRGVVSFGHKGAELSDDEFVHVKLDFERAHKRLSRIMASACAASPAEFRASLLVVQAADSHAVSLNTSSEDEKGVLVEARSSSDSLMEMERDSPDFRQVCNADLEVLGERVQAMPSPGNIKRPTGSLEPSRKAAIGRDRIERDPKVKSWVLQEAHGKCELCGGPAPFCDTHDQPFLEIHHVKQLAMGGSDTPENAVALCPNCHRRLHFGNDSEAMLDRLFTQIDRLVRE